MYRRLAYAVIILGAFWVLGTLLLLLNVMERN